MAIPHWSTPDGGEPVPAPDEPERVADALATLADPTRLEILAALAREGPLAYADLRAAAGVEDKGRFNYHLRELDGLLAAEDGPYRLTDRGEAALRRVAGEGAPAGE